MHFQNITTQRRHTNKYMRTCHFGYPALLPEIWRGTAAPVIYLVGGLANSLCSVHSENPREFWRWMLERLPLALVCALTTWASTLSLSSANVTCDPLGIYRQFGALLEAQRQILL
jgi:hypothetical protein